MQPQLFVVDGSNIATEGRSTPSLEQLNDAVMAFLEERPNAVVTVVVDATFGHRISNKEVDAFDEAVANNELVTPPAGAIGRGDAFVLSIANKAKAGILSNDSFQEFHGEYDWLFDEGRLIGGKPVPYVGWVFVTRTPVRGPKSRRSVRGAKDDAKSGDARAAKEQANRRVRPKAAATADETSDSPADEQPEAPSKRRRGGRGRAGGRAQAEATEVAPETQASAAPPGPKDQVNELMPFIEFVEKHPVGTSCTAEVESYASHGAYARAGDVLIYLPLRMLDDPPPRSAKSALKIGESIAVVITGFTPDRRSIDAALPHMATAQISAAQAPSDEPSRPARKRPARKSASSTSVASAPSADETTDDAPTGKSASARSGAGRTAAKKTAAKKTAAKKTAAKKTPAKKTPAKKTPAKKTPAKKTPAKKTPAKKTPAKKTPAKKTPAKKTAAKKTPARRGAATSSAGGDA
jgi:hypothetical protein